MNKATVIALCLATAVYAEKRRAWQEGKLVDVDRSSYFAGTIGGGTTTITNPPDRNAAWQVPPVHVNTGSQRAVYGEIESFVIESKSHVYTVLRTVRRKRPVNLTVNAPIKFAVERNRVYVIDDDRKEHWMEIVKRVLKMPTK